jgi:hypothetical protein
LNQITTNRKPFKEKDKPLWMTCYRLYHFKFEISRYICKSERICFSCGSREGCERVKDTGCVNCQEPICPRPFPKDVTPSPPGRVSTSVKLLQDIKEKGIIVVAGLIQDFHKYTEKIATSNIVVQSDNQIKVISRKFSSRYFDEGRKKSQRNIYKRLGSYHDSAVMVTLEYNPHKIGRYEAWANFNMHVSQFIKSLNQYLRRNNRRSGDKYRNIGFLRAVEQIPHWRMVNGEPIPNKSGGYPHIHIVFPGRRFLARIEEIENLWHYGMTQVKAYDNMNIVGYITKYVGKMEGWSDSSLAMIWHMRKRIYSYSKRYILPNYSEPKDGKWQYWGTLTSIGLKNMIAGNMDIQYIGVSPPG